VLSYSLAHSANVTTPIPVKNDLAIMQGSGLAAPKPAELLRDSVWSFEIQTSIQSHANDAASIDESLILDGEVQSISALFQWQFSPRWQANLELTGVSNTAGNFDKLIDQWHDAFGLDDGDRDLFPQNALRFEYTNSLGQTSLLDSASGLADTQIGLAYQIASNAKVNVSLHANLNLPTGNAASWLGSDKTDFSASMALSSAVHSSLSWHANFGMLRIGDDTLFGASTKSSVGFTSLGLHWQPNRGSWRWTAQLDGHEAVFDSTIPELNQPAWQLAFGLEFAKRWQIYFTEDLSVNRAADFSIGIRWRH